jgi:peroxiredoxin Q/BCP
LAFELLSDKDRRLVNALGVSLWISSEGEEFTVRTTIVVEKGGRVARVFEDVIVEGHLDAVIQTLRVLHGKGEAPVPEEPSQGQVPQI